MKRVSIVIPAYNEAASIPELHDRLSKMASSEKCEFEFIFVDDGSSDGTALALRALRGKDPRVSFLSLSRNFGHQAALSAGLDHARGDAVVFLDADLQHPPELVPRLIREWENGAQVVNTVRLADKKLGILKRATSAGFYKVVNVLSEVRVQPGGADFRLLDRRAADALREVEERVRFLRGLVQWIGFRQATVEYQPEPRFAGVSKFSARKMLRLAFDGIFSFSTVPLQLATWVGVLVSMGAFAYAAYAIYVWALGTVVPGWTSLLVVTLLLGGIQLITLGILGSYVARIYDEVRRRPLYLIGDAEGVHQKTVDMEQPRVPTPP